MKIFDCFTFFNELELLELRLMTLYDTIDYFVLVEAEETFTGKKKEFYYENNKEIFSKYSDKIIHIKGGKQPGTYAFHNEYDNRNLISNGLNDAEPEDWVIISDVDEIPNPIAIHEAIEKFEISVLEQKLYYYYVNCLQNHLWAGPVVIKKKLMNGPQDTRNQRTYIKNVIRNGGWHYSFIGGLDKIKTKLVAYSETETNNPEVNNDEHILKCLETGKDLFFREHSSYSKKFLTLEDVNHPELNEWLKKYPNMIKL